MTIRHQQEGHCHVLFLDFHLCFEDANDLRMFSGLLKGVMSITSSTKFKTLLPISSPKLLSRPGTLYLSL